MVEDGEIGGGGLQQKFINIKVASTIPRVKDDSDIINNGFGKSFV